MSPVIETGEEACHFPSIMELVKPSICAEKGLITWCHTVDTQSQLDCQPSFSIIQV